MKRCKSCEENLSLAEFVLDKRNLSGVGNICKRCKRNADRRNRRKGMEPWSPVEVSCTTCSNKFSAKKRTFKYCLECQSSGRADHDSSLKTRYGITLIEHEAIVALQSRKCAICKTEPTGGARLGVDHDHNCCPSSAKGCRRCIRGLLCPSCNKVLGIYESLGQEMENYLNNYRENGSILENKNLLQMR